MQKGFTTFSLHERGFTPILVLVGILVIIGVAGGIYYLGKSQSVKLPISQSQVSISPTSQPVSIDETANWKTYTSDTNHFSLKYPPAWEVRGIDDTRVSFVPASYFHNTSVNGNEILRIESGDDHRDLDYVKSEYYPTAIKTTIGNYTALREDKQGYAIIKISTSKSVEIRSVAFNEAIKYFDQIISTLKFTDQNQTPNSNPPSKTIKGTIQYLPKPGNLGGYEYVLINDQGFPVSDMSGQGRKVISIPLSIGSDQIQAQVKRDVGKTVIIYGNFAYYSEAPYITISSIQE